MPDRKNYGQFCALARSLDRVGDRWTLLVVRELLLGPRSYAGLVTALPGIGTNLLVDRLRRLEADGLVRRNDAPSRSKAVTYALTPAGAALETAVLELIRWGARWMLTGPGDDAVRPEWGVLALRALLGGPVGAPSYAVHIDLGEASLTVRAEAGTRTVLPGRPADADATVTAALPDLLAVAAGARPLAETGASIDGDADRARAALSPAG